MFSKLPNTASQMLDWSWDQYEPYFDLLTATAVTADNVDGWLRDYTQLWRRLRDVQSRLLAEVKRHTDNDDNRARYQTFMKSIKPKWDSEAQKIRLKLLESGLEPEGMAVPLRDIRGNAHRFREENLPLLTQENELGMVYDKILGSQTAMWQGKEYPLAQLYPLLQDPNRDIREEVWRLIFGRRLADREAINENWQALTDVRTQIAANADCADYRDYAWQQRKRWDYTPDNALQFLEAIEEVVIPIITKMAEQRKAQLGVDTLRPWDSAVDPHGRASQESYKDIAELISKTGNAIQKLDPELGTLFNRMVEGDLLDLDSRPAKAPGGYCTFLPITNDAFIFMNNRGTTRDISVLLHESGHAFHWMVSLAHTDYAFQFSLPMEFVEVPSMSMELLAAPYLTKEHGGFFTAEEWRRYMYELVEDIIKFWPYMATIVAFQHWAHTNHHLSREAANCDAKWDEIWHRFQPNFDWTGLEDMRQTGWQRQLHVHKMPFYYIEYGLAQLGAIQVWQNSLQDEAGAIDKYKSALALTGTKTLPDLFTAIGGRLAFDAETLRQSVDYLQRYLE